MRVLGWSDDTSDSAELMVTFRVRLSNAPPRQCVGYRNIVGGIHRQTDVLPGEIRSDGLPCFSGELRARRDAASGTPVLLGPFAFGPPSARFLLCELERRCSRRSG